MNLYEVNFSVDHIDPFTHTLSGNNALSNLYVTVSAQCYVVAEAMIKAQYGGGTNIVRIYSSRQVG